MDLPLRLRLERNQTPLDLIVSCPPETTVGEVAEAIAALTGAPRPCSLSSDPDPATPLSAARVRAGDLVEPVPPQPSTRSTVAARLHVAAGGPRAAASTAPLDLHPGIGWWRFDAGRAIPLPGPEGADVVLRVGRGVEVIDPGGPRSITIDGAAVRGAAGLAPGRVLGIGEDRLRLELLPAAIEDRPVLVGRAPAAPRLEPELRIDLPDAPGAYRPPRFPWLSVAAGGSMGLVFAASNPGWGTGAMAGAMVTMMVASGVEQRREAARTHRQAVDDWEESLEELRTEAEAERHRRLERRRLDHPAVEDFLIAAGAPGGGPGGLWRRGVADERALEVAVGRGTAPSGISLIGRRVGTTDRRTRNAEVGTEAAWLPPGPLLADLTRLGHLGICGPVEHRTAAARAAITRLAIATGPSAVRLAVVCPPERRHVWDWIKWLPHLDSPNLVTDPDHPGAIGRLCHGGGDGRRCVVLVDGVDLAHRRVWRTLLDDGPSAGVHAVWLAQTVEHLPSGCGAHIDLHGEPDGGAAFVESTIDRRTALEPERLSHDEADALARSLAPLIECDLTDRLSLPERVGLLGLLDAAHPDPATVAASVAGRWSRHLPGGALRLPIGAATTGVVTLDLRLDGPHALVAGTTGAGKSELLQTMVCGLAASAPPERVTFVLVDFKGGAAFAACAELPHVVGMVTDLDAPLVTRTLAALRAEVRRREELFAEAGVPDLVAFERHDPHEAPPALVVVVDEFAALRTDHPAFLDGIVDLAQRGRSLGIHLVLATQRPAGVVTDQIRANTNLRIALRTADPEDSRDVVGDETASTLPRSRPGRALIRIGPDELLTVQTGYGGGPMDADAGRVRIRPFALGEETTDPDPAPDSPTELEVLVAAIRLASDAGGHPEPRRPWLDPLPDHLPLGELPPDGPTPGAAVFARDDDPDRRRSEPVAFDPSIDGGLLVSGRPGSGTSGTLAAIAAALGRSEVPTEVVALDATGALAALTALPHVADVIDLEDHERVVRVIGELTERVRARDEGSRRTVVLVDTWEAFAACYDRVLGGRLVEDMTRLVRDGRAGRVGVVLSTTRAMAVPASVSSSITRRVELAGSESDAFTSSGPPLAASGAGEGGVVVPGRGRHERLTVQIACASACCLTGITWAGWATDKPATAPPRLPAVWTSGHGPRIVALDVDHLSPLPVDPMRVPTITGPPGSGRSNALVVWARALAAAGRPVLVVAADGAAAPTGLEAAPRLPEGELRRRVESGALDPRTVLVIDDADGRFEDEDAFWTPVIRRADRGGPAVLAAVEATWWRRAWGDAATALRDRGCALLLRPDHDQHGMLAGVDLPRRSLLGELLPATPGRGYLVTDGGCRPVQVRTAPTPATGVTRAP